LLLVNDVCHPQTFSTNKTKHKLHRMQQVSSPQSQISSKACLGFSTQINTSHDCIHGPCMGGCNKAQNTRRR
jgi:hypothetical protein